MDEAVIRIVLDGSKSPNSGTGAGGGSTSAPAGSGSTSAGNNAGAGGNAGASTQPPQQITDWMKSFINPLGANPHVLLEGQSGSGKSFAARHIAFQRMDQGQDVSVVTTHAPETWGGAKEMFTGTNKEAGTAATDYINRLLEGRKKEANEAAAKGEKVSFKPLTVVLSDFEGLLKDVPKLGEAVKRLAAEGRKFELSLLAETTSLTRASTGVQGILGLRANFGQQAKFFDETSQGGTRRAEVAGKSYQTPELPGYEDRIDPNVAKPSTLPPEEDKKKKKEKSLFDVVLGVADQFRGTIGGVAGTLIGSTLDAVSAIRKAQVAVDKGEGVIGAAAGAVAAGVVASVVAFKALNSEVNEMASKYARYSPEIAGAQAQSDVRAILGDIRRSQSIGPEISEYIRAQTDLQQGWEDTKAKFMKAALPLMTTVVSSLAVIVNLIGGQQENAELFNNDFFNFNPETAFRIPPGFGV